MLFVLPEPIHFGIAEEVAGTFMPVSQPDLLTFYI